METTKARVTNIHTWAFTNRFKSFKDFNLVSTILGVNFGNAFGRRYLRHAVLLTF
jgi:hypothetical protein